MRQQDHAVARGDANCGWRRKFLHWRPANRIFGKSRLLCTIERAGQIERTSRAASATRVSIVRTEREAEMA